MIRSLIFHILTVSGTGKAKFYIRGGIDRHETTLERYYRSVHLGILSSPIDIDLSPRLSWLSGMGLPVSICEKI